ncbi:MAG: alpha/beta hydrolase [Alphaproteobacteria bacterium]|nr:alpha/beta hydrolase [Alphaproteobacteria bacterium]
MDAKTPYVARERISFEGRDGNLIAADLHPSIVEPHRGIVLMVHGGGQTRHSWRGSSNSLAQNGWSAITMDQRGHGDSAWSETGDYEFAAFAEDLVSVADQVAERFGSRPVVVGASLGGISAMLAEGETPREVLSSVILVDVTPRLKLAGVVKILGFMSERADDGFASLQEAADAIARYLPNRPKRKDLSGLAKNLRLGDDGRYRWHWDPRFLASRRRHGLSEERAQLQVQLADAVRAISVPLMLVRGRQSELVDEEMVAEFLDLAPHAKVADVSEAGHMVAGDKNDVFTSAVLDFLSEI